MRARIEAENIERVRAQLESLIQTVNKGNRASGEAIKSAASFGTEQRTLLRNQNLIINSWRLMHPQLSILTRGLSNVATVGHVLVNAFQALNIMQLRQKESARDLADLLQKRLDLAVQIKKAEKEFGALDPRVLELKGSLAEVNSELGKLEDNLKSQKWQDLGNKLAIALSLVGVGANIFNAITAFKALGVVMVGTGGAGGLVAISKLVSKAFVSMWAKVLAPVAVVLALDYVIAKMRNIPSVLEIAAAQFPAADFTDILPTLESTKKAQELLNKRIQAEGGASLIGMANLPTIPQNPSVPQAPTLPTNPPKPDFWDWLKNSIIVGLSVKPNAGLAFGETGGVVPVEVMNFKDIPANIIGQGGVTSQFRDISFGTPSPTQKGQIPISDFTREVIDMVPFGAKTQSQVSKAVSINALGSATFTKSAGIQSDLNKAQQAYAESARINGEIAKLNQQLKESIPSLNQARPAEGVIIQRTRDEQSKRLAELQIQSSLKMNEYANFIVKYNNTKRDFEDLTGVSFTEWERMQQLAKQEGLDFNEFLALRSPAVATRLGIQVGRAPDALSGLLNIPTGGMSFEEIGVLQQAGLLTGVNLTNALDNATRIKMATAANKELQGLRNIGVGGAFIQPGTFTVGIRSETAESKAAQTAAFIANRRNRTFASGGIINEPIIGTGLNTGAGYMFGESGPETITPGSGGGGNGGMVVNVYVSGSLVAEADLIRKVSEGVARGIQRQVR